MGIFKDDDDDTGAGAGSGDGGTTGTPGTDTAEDPAGGTQTISSQGRGAPPHASPAVGPQPR